MSRSLLFKAHWLEKIFLLLLLSFQSSMGQLYDLSRIRFSGAEKISPQTIIQNLQKLETGRKDSKTLLNNLQKVYHENGFVFAKITSKKIKSDSLLFTILEGPICFLQEANGIPDSVHLDYFSNLPQFYNPEGINQAIESWISSMEEDGKPLASIKIENIVVKTINPDSAAIIINLKFSNLETIIVNNIVISGLQYTDSSVVIRELAWTYGLTFTPELQKEMVESLNKLRIFKFVKNPEIVEFNGQKNIFIEIIEGQAMAFDGIVGYIPEKEIAGKKEKGYFTGLLDMNFGNLFGSARKLSIHWKKPDALSDEFNLRYKEPWILGVPLNGIAGFHRRVQDTLFLKQGYDFTLEYPMSYRWQLYARFDQNRTQPDSNAAISLGITRNTHRQYITGITYDNRDFPINPKRGVYCDANFSYGNKKIDGPVYLLEKDSTIERKQDTQVLRLRAEGYLELFKNSVIALKLNLALLQVTPGKPDDADLFWFGGAGSFRGYRENQFRSDRFIISSIEYRLLTGQRSRIFAFIDHAYFDNFGENLNRIGYGVGVRMESGLGILAIDYGLASGDPFSQGKIHMGIVNEF